MNEICHSAPDIVRTFHQEQVFRAWTSYSHPPGTPFKNWGDPGIQPFLTSTDIRFRALLNALVASSGILRIATRQLGTGWTMQIWFIARVVKRGKVENVENHHFITLQTSISS
jgi:hypothetical protein